ncbi:hypothetical protein ACKX2L_06355 [Lachnospiraceae bacterium YH-ros2228]
MKFVHKVNRISTIGLIILAELLFAFAFYEFWTDPVRTKVYHKEKTESKVPTITEESVETYLLNHHCTRLDVRSTNFNSDPLLRKGSDSDTIAKDGLPDGTEGFVDINNNIVWYLLLPAEENTADAMMDAVKEHLGKIGTVNVELDTRHRSVVHAEGNGVAGYGARSHTVLLVGISRDGKHMDALQQTIKETGFSGISKKG